MHRDRLHRDRLFKIAYFQTGSLSSETGPPGAVQGLFGGNRLSLRLNGTTFGRPHRPKAATQAFGLASLLREPSDQGLDIDHAAKHLIEHVLVSFGGVLIDHRDHDPQLLRLRGEGGKTSDKLAVIHVSHAFRVPWRATGSQSKGGRKEVKGKKCVDGAFVISGRIVSRMLKERLMAAHRDDGAANLLTGDQECAVQHQDNSLPFN